MSILDNIAAKLNRPFSVLKHEYTQRDKNFYSEPTDVPAGAVAYEALVQTTKNMGVTLKMVPHIPSESGVTLGRTNRTILVTELVERKNKTGMAATLAHELSHLIISLPPSTPSEAIAESSAALIMEHFGIDWEERATDYLIGYSVSGDNLLSVRKMIERTAEAVLSYVPEEGKTLPEPLGKESIVDVLEGLFELAGTMNNSRLAEPWQETGERHTPPEIAQVSPADVIRAVLPQQDPVDVPAGFFDYVDAAGKDHHSLFVVHTVPNQSTLQFSRPQDDAQRQDDLNAQYIMAYDQLQAQGARRIRYTVLHPDPFF